MSKLLDMIIKVGVDEALDRLLNVGTMGKKYDKTTCSWVFLFEGDAGELTMRMAIDFDEGMYYNFGEVPEQRENQAWMFGARKMRDAMRHKIIETLNWQVNFIEPKENEHGT